MLTDKEIKLLVKGLDFQCKNNELKLRRGFDKSCRRMRLKWHFRDERQSFKETPAFTPKSTWHPTKRHVCLNVFLSQLEKELFEILFSDLKYSDMSWNDCLLEVEKNQGTLKFTEMLITLKMFSASYQKQVIKFLVVIKGEIF